MIDDLDAERQTPQSSDELDATLPDLEVNDSQVEFLLTEASNAVSVATSRERTETFRENEIMPSNVGRISCITISLTENNNQNFQAYLETVLSILRGKSSDPDFSVCIIYDDDFLRNEFESMLFYAEMTNKLSVTYIKSDERLHSIWIRDDGIRKGGNTIMLPRNHRHNGHTDLASNEGSGIIESDLLFEAGDIRATESHVFVGFNTVYENVVGRGGESKENITAEEIEGVVSSIEKQLGKKVVVVGLELGSDGRYQPINGRQEIFHTDMIVTPMNDKDVLVAEMKDNAELEMVAKQLHDQGFNVVRVPYDEFRIGLGSRGQLTYNNVLLEKYGEVKRVYLPQYFIRGVEEKSWHVDPHTLEELNRSARETYAAQGYEVIPIEVSLSMANQRGSVNCLTFEQRV